MKLTLPANFKNVQIMHYGAALVAFGIIGSLLLTSTHAATPTGSLEAEGGALSNCAHMVNDSSASSAQAVKFGTCSGSVDDPTNLDASGATIPDSDYAIPSGAIFMSTTGSDSNSGTQSSPVKTLNKAVSLVASGGTIVVRGGTTANPSIYRDWYYTDNTNLGAKTFGVITKPVTIQAYPHEKAWFDGTDVEPTAGWTSDGAGHWYMDWSTPSFCGTLPTASTSNYYSTPLESQLTGSANGPCTYHDASLDPTNPMAGDPQMAFIDGTYVHQVKTLAEATGNNFYYDWTNKKIYIATNPSGHTVELAARPMAMQLNGAGSKILGLGFTRYATHTCSNNTGVIYGGAANQTYENDAFTKMAGFVLGVNKPGGTVEHSVFANNGGTALGGNGSGPSGGADNLLVADNVFNASNTELFWTNCTYSCGAANIKFTKTNTFTITNNIIENAKGHALGVWCDVACTAGKYTYNVVRNNGTSGIMYEISDNAIIASNLVYGNGAAGIRIASAHTKVYNNTVVNNNTTGTYQGNIWIYDDPRNPSNPDTGATGASMVGPDTVGTYSVNNIIAGSGRMNSYQGATGSTNTEPDQFFDLLDYNAYWRFDGSSQVLVHWVYASPSSTTDYTSASAFTAAHAPLDTHSIDIAGGSDPFFVDAANGNYAVRSGSSAYHSSTTIPDDVAAALGITTKTGLSRGVISWPGQ